MKKNIKRIICFALFVVVCLGALTSCVPSYSKAKDSPVAMQRRLSELEKTENYDFGRYPGYYVEGEIEEDKDLWIDGVEDILYVYLYDDENWSSQDIGFFIYCESAKDARKNTRTLKEYAKINNPHDDYSDFIIRRNGNLIYAGERSLWREATGNPLRGIAKGLAITSGVVAAIVAFVVVLAIIITAVIVVLLLMKKKASPATDTAEEAVITEAPSENAAEEATE